MGTRRRVSNGAASSAQVRSSSRAIWSRAVRMTINNSAHSAARGQRAPASARARPMINSSLGGRSRRHCCSVSLARSPTRSGEGWPLGEIFQPTNERRRQLNGGPPVGPAGRAQSTGAGGANLLQRRQRQPPRGSGDLN